MIEKKTTAKNTKQLVNISKPKLQAMIEEATVDCYGESEQVTGLFTKIEDNLKLPFRTSFLGVEITVERIDLNHRDQIMAICARGRERQAVRLVDLRLPSP